MGAGRETVKGFQSSAVCAEHRSRDRMGGSPGVAGADMVHVLGYRDPVGTMAASGAFQAGVPDVLEPCGMTRRRIRSMAVKRASTRRSAGRSSTARPG